MTANAIAVSRRLVERGVDKKTADAVAEEFADFKDVVDYREDNLVTKSHFDAALGAAKAEFKADIARMETKFNIGLALLVAIFAAILSDKL